MGFVPIGTVPAAIEIDVSLSRVRYVTNEGLRLSDLDPFVFHTISAEFPFERIRSQAQFEFFPFAHGMALLEPASQL